PLPPHAGIGFEQIDSNYFWITGDDVPSAHIENFSYYDAYILKKSLADAITSFACQSQNSDRCITFNYLVKNKNVEIARVINQSEVEFWIRTPNMLLRVRNPDLLPSLTAKDLQTLEMIILNIRSKI
ncbi:MAG TPA: hypothetical protein VHA52_07550, partial [Candidatus Babeliaceae bacterium]|nr:hypothetical protein [Candidatus Babeliaceae bacterium]